MNGKKGIIIYFTRVGNTNFKENVDAVSSASLMEENGTLIGNSELLAEMLENATGYPSYAIKTKKKYSSGYGDTVSEAKKEMDDNTPSELEKDVPELSEYDTVVLVYPLWWGTLPMPVQTFLEENDMDGKTIYSLVTHGGSGFGSAIQVQCRNCNFHQLQTYYLNYFQALPLYATDSHVLCELLKLTSDSAVEDYAMRGMSWKFLAEKGFAILTSSW